MKNYIIDILSALVQDGDSLPQEVMDVIFSNILEPVKVRGGGMTTIKGGRGGGQIMLLRKGCFSLIFCFLERLFVSPLQTENKVTYAFTVDFIRKTSSHIEPYIHLVSRAACLDFVTLTLLTVAVF